MPLYFFDFIDGDTILHDELGSFLADDCRARGEVKAVLSDQVRATLAQGRRHIEVRVRDTTGRVLYRASLEFQGVLMD